MLTVALTGDRAMVENVLEVRALAQKFGLTGPHVTLIREPAIVPKKAIPELRTGRRRGGNWFGAGLNRSTVSW